MKKYSPILFMMLVGAIAANATSWSYPTSAIEDPSGKANTDIRDGSKNKPYTISTAQELANFAYYVNNHSTGAAYKDKYVVLTADIVLNDWVINEKGEINSSAQKWTPIGEYGTFFNDSFEGVFLGNGHTISGVYVDTERSYNGFFGDLKHGSIKDLHIKDSYIVRGSKCAGGIVAHVHGSYSSHSVESEQVVENCSFQGIIEGNNTTSTYVGGIVGHEESSASFSIKNCVTNGSINNANASYIGGVCAMGNKTNITDCINRMYISGGKGNSVGGISGKTLNVNNCLNYGNITNNTAKYIGGIVGDITNPVTKCTNFGDITLLENGPSYVGGIIGMSTNNITFCGNFGDINAAGATSSSEMYIGGIVGQTGFVIQQSYNHGNITASSSNIKRAGLVGDYKSEANYGNIKSSFNTGNISGGYAIAAKVSAQGDMTDAKVLWLDGVAIQGFPGTDGDTKRSKDYFTNNTIPGNAFDIMENTTGVLWGSDVNNNGYPIPNSLGGVNTYFYLQGEHGTEQNPYIIENIADINELRKRVTSGDSFEGEFFNQVADLDFSSEENFVPIGVKFNVLDYAGNVVDLSTTHPFAGNYDGNNQLIKGITVNNATKCGAALFAENHGTIKNLIFDGFSNVDNSVEPADVAVVAISNHGIIGDIVVTNINLNNERATAAGVVGTNSGLIENISVNNAIFNSKHAGGIVGTNSGRVVNTLVYDATLNGMYAGGIAASSSGSIESASVFNTNLNGMCLGGIAGVTEDGSIMHSTSAAVLDTRNCELEQGEQPYIGGLVGLADGVSIQYSYATNETANYLYDSSKNPIMGGLIGSNEKQKNIQINSSVAPWTGDFPKDIQFGPIAGNINLNSSYSIANSITYAKQYFVNSNTLVWDGVASQMNNATSKNMSYLYKYDKELVRTDVEWDVKYFDTNNMVQGYHMVLPKYSPTTYQVKTTAKYTSAVVAEADKVEGNISYLDMTARKAIDNTIFYPINAEDVMDEFYDLPNVCDNNTVRNLHVIDGKDFTCSDALTAEKISFERKNIARWTAMCLPFNISQDMLPEKASIEEVIKIDAEKGKIYTQTTSSINAGEPFLLYCEDEDFVISLYQYNNQIATSPTIVFDAFYGAFATTNITSEYFVLDQLGEYFVKVENDNVLPFNAYLLDENLINFESIEVIHNPTTLIEDIEIEENTEKVIYDIYGRRLFDINSPGVYIVNGKKMFIK
ncbi:MAG: hypothetical protein IKV32_06130 [Muribaculaceae bacterium]|nr:hypothetical protein [Muribaculaceae bacterium]